MVKSAMFVEGFAWAVCGFVGNKKSSEKIVTRTNQKSISSVSAGAWPSQLLDLPAKQYIAPASAVRLFPLSLVLTFRLPRLGCGRLSCVGTKTGVDTAVAIHYQPTTHLKRQTLATVNGRRRGIELAVIYHATFASPRVAKASTFQPNTDNESERRNESERTKANERKRTNESERANESERTNERKRTNE